MDNAHYLDVALRLANADLADVAALSDALHDEPWWSERVDDSDLRVLRPVAVRLRRVLSAAADADAEGVLAETNVLLSAHPLRPRLSGGHGSTPDWHIHVADPEARPATEVAAAASWGVAQGIVHYGLERWGRCGADGGGNLFLDTS